jgi:hypothetical protein
MVLIDSSSKVDLDHGRKAPKVKTNGMSGRTALQEKSHCV